MRLSYLTFAYFMTQTLRSNVLISYITRLPDSRRAPVPLTTGATLPFLLLTYPHKLFKAARPFVENAKNIAGSAAIGIYMIDIVKILISAYLALDSNPS